MEVTKQNSIVTQNSSQRIACLDYARVFAAFLVIYGHLYSYNPENYVRVFIYQFHMPFFFLVSGMLHKYNGSVQWKKYIRTLVVPILFFQILYYLYYGLMFHLHVYSDREGVVGANIWATYINYGWLTMKRMVKGIALFCGPSWFLIALLYCKLFFDSFYNHRKIGVLVWSLLFISLCYFKHRYLFVANFVMAFPFYVLGFCSKKYLSKLISIKYKFIWIALSAVLVILIMYINGTVSTLAITFTNLLPIYLGIPLYYLAGILGSCMMLFIAAYFKQSSKILPFLGNALISIVGFQNLFIGVISHVWGINKGVIVSIGIASVIFLLCIGSHALVMHYAPWLLGKSKN